MSDMSPNYRKVAETKKPPTKGGQLFCFHCPEKVATVVCGHPANHSWKRMVSQAQRCLASPLPSAIVFANKKEDFCTKKQINMHIVLGHLIL